MDRKQQLKTPPILSALIPECLQGNERPSLSGHGDKDRGGELSWVWIWGKERTKDHPSGHVLPCQGRALPLLGEQLHPDSSHGVPMGAARRS